MKTAETFRSPRRIARRFRYLPLAREKIRNWPSFMFHYALGLKPRHGYLFRNGARLILSRPLDHAAIIEIFLKEDYGVVPDGAVVIDIGANIGIFTIYATTTAKGVRVFAYEPFLEFCEVLEENLHLNRRIDSVRWFNCAVASEPGLANLNISGERFYFPTLLSEKGGHPEERVAVRSTTLDEIIESNNLKQIDLLKLDCEGAEYQILYSASPLQLKKLGRIRMEYHNLDTGERNGNALKRFFAATGFTLIRFQPVSDEGGILWTERPEAGG